MKKIILLSMLSFLGFSQNDETTEKDTTYWTKGGVITFLANQSTFKNWQAGGESNISANLNANYDINYEKGDWVLKNKIQAAYGITKIKGLPEQKTDDRFEVTSNLGKRASGHWFYSLFFNFRTQFDHGLDQSTGIRISEFMSPAFIQLGPGMLWKKSDNLRFNLAPASTRLIIVDRKFTQEGSSFGVEQGETTRWEFGASLNGYYRFKIMENVTVENILNLYSNYIEDPQNVDIDYQLNIVMKINTYLSTNFNFQMIYDDNAFRGLQTRQVIGLGVNVKL